MIALAAKLYRMLIHLGIVIAPLALLIIRLAWGWELFESGRSHLADVPGMVEKFTSWGIPYPKPNVYLSGCTEMIGGLLWMAGLGTRLISIPLLINFCVAYWTASHDKVVEFFHQNPSNFIDDAAFPFLVASLVLLSVGPGIISIDAMLKRTIFQKHATGLPTAPAPN